MRGYIIVLISALAFAANNALSVLAYEGGATPLTLIAVRMPCTLLLLYLYLRLARIAIPLPPRERTAALALGLLNGTMAFCLMSAFHHIAVGLAILVFYLYPIFTALGAWATGQDRLSKAVAVGLAGSFTGLALALDIETFEADKTGLAFAAAASVLMAAVALTGARILKTGNAQSVTMHMHISASTMFLLASAVLGELSLPETSSGWIGFLSVPFAYTLAVAAFFAGISWIGPVRASLVMNLEPVASIALGYILLAQHLSEIQLLGAAIVIASVTIVRALARK